MRSAPRSQRGPDGFRPAGLAGVRRQMQSRLAREAETLREPLRRAARLVAADAEADHALAHALGRQLRPRAWRRSTPNCRTASKIQRTSTGERARLSRCTAS